MFKSMKHPISLILIITLSILYIQCKKQAIDKNTISVSILPQRYFLERITGGRFTINVMIPPGYNPATYEPSPQQMKAISKSSIYFRIGHIPFENVHMETLHSLNPDMIITDTSQGVTLLYGNDQHLNDQHDEHDDHNHKGVDPHIWLSPHAVKTICANMLTTLCEQYPDQCNYFTTNYNNFIKDITVIDKSIDDILKKRAGNKFLVFHPAWGYFARDYGLEQIAIEFEGKDPNPQQIKKIIDSAKENNIHVIFVQQQFSTDSAQAIANDIHGQAVQLDPLSEDWLKNLEKIARALKKGLN